MERPSEPTSGHHGEQHGNGLCTVWVCSWLHRACMGSFWVGSWWALRASVAVTPYMHSGTVYNSCCTLLTSFSLLLGCTSVCDMSGIYKTALMPQNQSWSEFWSFSIPSKLP